MPCNTAKAQNHTCMLHRVILIIEPCPHDSHIRTHTVSQHFFQPVGINDFRVVIQQQKIFTLCIFCTEIIDIRIVEGAIPVHHMYLWITCLQFFIICEGFFLGAVVFNNDIFIIPVGGFFLNGRNTPFQICSMILVGNQNGDQRVIFTNIAGPVKSQILPFINLCLYAGSFIMCLNGPLACIKGIHFALRILRSGILMAPPVIKNPGNMINIFCSFHTAPDKIVILGAVKFRPQHSNLIQKLFFYHKKMADIIYSTKQIQVEIRLEMRKEKTVSFNGHFILIRIQNLCFRPFIDGFHTGKQRVSRQCIIVIRKRNKITCGRLNGRICIFCDPQRFLMGNHPDSGILSFILLQKFAYGRIHAAAV